MYYITYRNVLKSGKTLEDYRKGLKHVWPILQGWGATKIELFQPLYNESGSFYSRYTIGSLDTWNEHIQSREFYEMLNHLSDILDLSQSGVETSVALETGL